jgi:hypothetical protein
MGCTFSDPNPPKRLKIDKKLKVGILEFKINRNDTILVNHSEENYDSLGKLRETVTFFNSKNDFSKIRNQQIFLYDSLDNNIEIISCNFDDSYGDYFYDTTKFEYDSYGNIILEITGRGGILQRKHFYVYDSLNRLTKDYIYRWGYGQFLVSYQTLYTYDTLDNLIEKKEYSIFLNPEPELIATETFKYDKSSNMIYCALNESSSTSPGNFVYNLTKQLFVDLNGLIKKEWYDLQTIDFAFSQLLPDTVYFNYNEENKKVKETRIFTSNLKNKEFNSEMQKNVYLKEYQTDNKYIKIEQEKYFYDKKSRLTKVEYYSGEEPDKMLMRKIKKIKYK